MFIIKLSLSFSFLLDKFLSIFYKKEMKRCGKSVYLRPISSDLKGLWNLSIGDYTSVPKGSVFYCTEAPLTIGNKVIFGPHPTIITGDHRIDVIGKYIIDSHEKLPENDAPVIIEDDVWTGANITILKGVTIGRGSVGVPAKVLKFRFTVEDVLEHERKLYPEDKRFTREELIEQRKAYIK